MKKVLYKYLPAGRDSYLDDELLRFTQPGALNDPFEILPSITSEQVVEVCSKQGFFHQCTKGNRASRRAASKQHAPIKEGKEAIPMSETIRQGFLKKMRKVFDEEIGIFSLSRRWDSGLMWAHYTEAHKGFCLGLWKDSLTSQFKENPLSKIGSVAVENPVAVIYSDTRVQVPLAREESPDPKQFYTKAAEWEYEAEERLVTSLADRHKVTSVKSSHDIYLFRIPHNWIAEITIGMRTDEGLSCKIIEVAKRHGFSVYKAKLSQNTFNIERKLIYPRKQILALTSRCSRRGQGGFSK